jgi:hypothetical protein
MISVTTNAADVAAELEQLAQDLLGIIDEQLRAAAAEGAERLADLSPRRTGEYASSWRAEGTDIVNDAPYASFVDLDLSRAVDPDALANRIDAAIERRQGV